MSKTQVLLVSQFSSSSQNYCYAEFLHKLLLQKNKKVATFDCKRDYFKLRKSADELPRPLRFLNNFLANFLLCIAIFWHRPAKLLLVKGENISYMLLRLCKAILKFELINFYPDSPFCLWNGNSSINVIKSLHLYDHFVTWSHHLANTLIGAGVKSTGYWPFLADSQLFFPAVKEDAATADAFYTSDVCFVGAYDEKRAAYLTVLQQALPDLNLKIWGLGWEKCLQTPQYPLTKAIHPQALTPAQMRQAFISSKIVLNFLRPQNLDALNMRTLEVAACQAFLLTEYSDVQAHEILQENFSVVCFSNAQELISKVKLYLDLAPMREKIAQAGYKRFLELQRQYCSQVQEILRI